MFRFGTSLSLCDCKAIAQCDGALYALQMDEYVLYFFLGLLPDHICLKYGGRWAIGPSSLPPDCVCLSDAIKAG